MKAAPCGDSAECLNRILRIECTNSCPAKDKCENRRFQKRVYPPIEVAMTNGRGWGLFIKVRLIEQYIHMAKEFLL